MNSGSYIYGVTATERIRGCVFVTCFFAVQNSEEILGDNTVNSTDVESLFH